MVVAISLPSTMYNDRGTQTKREQQDAVYNGLAKTRSNNSIESPHPDNSLNPLKSRP